MGLKIGQNINFRSFFYFFQLLGRDTACLAATQFLGCDTACLVATVSGQLLVFLLQLVGAITSSF